MLIAIGAYYLKFIVTGAYCHRIIISKPIDIGAYHLKFIDIDIT